MTVIVTSKTTISMVTYTNVTSLTFTNNNYVITVGSTSYTYAAASYMVIIA